MKILIITDCHHLLPEEAEKLADEIYERTNGHAEGITKAKILIARGKRCEKNKQK